MNSNTVLGKIMTLLSVKSGEVHLAFARLSDGTLLESATFDVGESVEVVQEDGTKIPAPDGEHELELTGEDGETVRFKIITEGGVITERENVELQDEEIVDAEPLPGDEPVEMEIEPGISVDEEVVDKTPEETVNLEDIKKTIEEMAYRIDELEKKLVKKEEEKIEEEEMMEDEEDVEDKKLDGAPVEMSKVNDSTFKPKHLVKNYQNSVLSKLYRN